MAEQKFKEGMNAIVTLPLPVFKRYIYSIPLDLAPHIKIGIPVFVPFGKRNVTGYITGLCRETPEGVKAIKEIIDIQPFFSPQLLEVFSWISNYYLTPPGLVIKASVPPRLSIKETVLVFAREDSPKKILNNSQALSLYQKLLKRPLSRNYIRWKYSSFLDAYNLLLRTGLIYEKIKKTLPSGGAMKDGVTLTKPFEVSLFKRLSGKAPKQAEIYAYLSKIPNGVRKQTLYASVKKAYTAVRALEKKGILTFFTIPFEQKIPCLSVKKKKKPRLTQAQKKGMDKIRNALEQRRYETFLLFGVTGSGKTEIYLRTAEEILKMGKGVIILVSEVSLTAQTVEVFKARFGDSVVLYHSRLSDRERIEIWRGIREGKYPVIIGARFAIFAPLPNLGAIIIDEEHESTYKQKGKEPFYSARDTAVLRARLEKAVCILGSATPSVESFHNAQKGKYTLIELPERIDERKLPSVKIVDMRKEKDYLFSRSLKEKIKDRITKREQIILFINRRGFSNFLVCRDCGLSPRCPFCDVTLTYHRKDLLLKCHHCGHEERAPRSCPACKGTRFFYAGMGTQRIERYLEKEFTELHVVRMDIDSTKRKWAHMELFFKFREGESDLLLGTQMVAKGFDLPKVTLVGVISADTTLNFPDFRAQERTFQLLTQVAGRTGRGTLGGEVIIQTYAPEHYAIQESKLHNYEGFYRKEIEIRKELNYPPFSRLARIILLASEEQQVHTSADNLTHLIKELIKKKGYKIDVLGPLPCPLTRLKGKYRYHILLKCKKPFLIQKILLSARAHFKTKGLRIMYDIDPFDMM